MKTIIVNFAILLISMPAFAKNTVARIDSPKIHVNKPYDDSVKLIVDAGHAYYQKVVKADSIPEAVIYLRAIQFMASKNFQQNYGYQEEGKLIFTTSQDLNVNPVYVGDEDDIVNSYNTQFSITLDLKNRKYRYTISNVVFFFPTDNGNKRETLYDVYLKSVSDSRRVSKAYKMIIASFEKYITSLTNELHEGIEQKLMIYNPKF